MKEQNAALCRVAATPEIQRNKGVKRHGVRRQSGSGDGAFGGRDVDGRVGFRSKAVSRCACRRSPKSSTCISWLTYEMRGASWSAPALWRFGMKTDAGKDGRSAGRSADCPNPQRVDSRTHVQKNLMPSDLARVLRVETTRAPGKRRTGRADLSRRSWT